MPETPTEKSNPVVETYRGIEVRKYNVIHLRVDSITYKEMIDAGHDTGLSQRKILAYSSMPCRCCEGTNVIVFTDNGERKIKRGILSRRIPNTCGVTQTKKYNDAQGDRIS